MQIENLPLFCLANHNMFTHTVITMSKLVIVFQIKSLCMYITKVHKKIQLGSIYEISLLFKLNRLLF